MIKNKFIVDEIIQKFDTAENTYVKLGSITGNVNEQNEDILEEECTIIIPKSKVEKFCSQFNEAMNFLPQKENTDTKEIEKLESKSWYGKALIFKK
jgi:hypothetical protein